MKNTTEMKKTEKDHEIPKKIMKWILISICSIVGLAIILVTAIFVYFLVADFFYTDPNAGNYQRPWSN